jgi:hypothetical protein
MRTLDSGRTYYADHNTKETTWDRPVTPPPEAKDKNLAPVIISQPLPPKWEARRSGDNNVYLHNTSNAKSTACLWRGVSKRRNQRAKSLKVSTKGDKEENSQTLPKPDEKIIDISAIKPKEYCQLKEFFSQSLNVQYNMAMLK